MDDRPHYESSIVIPVFNNWDLTRQCLKSLAATTNRERVEVIVVDNASSDITPGDCPVFGQSLFGASFRYLRNEQNRNFAGASNQGVLAGHGQYVIFLNNDTEALPGWYEPLMDDFSRHEKIAATGPVLLYPPDDVFGQTVQHLGIVVTPFFKLQHLHKHIPAASPLAGRRRFFQAITAACMAMPRSLFLDIGMFDERFINGYEDVDLCGRLWQAGWRMTINPESRIVHYESKSANRYQNEKHNAELLFGKSLSGLGPDFHLHIEKDGLDLKLNDWLLMVVAERTPVSQKLDRLGEGQAPGQLLKMLTLHPYWEKGLLLLAEKTGDYAARQIILNRALNFHKNPNALLAALQLAIENGDMAEAKELLPTFSHFMGKPDLYREMAKEDNKYLDGIGLRKLAAQVRSWLDAYPEFEKKHAQLAARIGELERRMNTKL